MNLVQFKQDGYYIALVLAMNTDRVRLLNRYSRDIADLNIVMVISELS